MKIQQVYRGAWLLAGTVVLSGVTAMAQMSPQSAPMQSSPNATTPGTNQGSNGGMTPAEQSDAMQNNAGAMQDKAFVRDALQGGMAEVQLGQLAVQKGSSDDVKQFGQRMVDDHTKLDDQMKPVAQQLGVSMPSGPSKKDMELMSKLQAMSGADFDNAYIKAMVKDHKKDNDSFKSEAAQTQNSTLQQVAKQGDMVIQQHLEMIEQIAKAHNVSGKDKMSSGQ